jgi:uncharacterized membrane protein YhaH (DUF805 family)
MRSSYPANRIGLRLAFWPLTHAFTFGGRSTRKEVVSFWLLDMLAHAGTLSVDTPPSSLSYVLGIAWALLWKWPWVPLLIRRLHDQGRSGWWAALQLGFIPPALYASLIAPAGKGTSISFHLGSFAIDREIGWYAGMIAMLPVVLLGVVIFVLYLLPPTKGANRFGRDPRRDVAPEREGNAVPAET